MELHPILNVHICNYMTELRPILKCVAVFVCVGVFKYAISLLRNRKTYSSYTSHDEQTSY